jgi:hypothetical protein
MKKRYLSAQHVFVLARCSLPSSCVFRRSSDALPIATITLGRDSNKRILLLLRVFKFSMTKYYRRPGLCEPAGSPSVRA